MSVKVMYTEPNSSAVREGLHPTANVVSVAEGHLLVRDGGRNKTVATYAPGNWWRAEVEES